MQNKNLSLLHHQKAKVMLSGALLIANVFLMAIYNASDRLCQPHPFSTIYYEYSVFLLQNSLYFSPIIYCLVYLINADLNLFRVNLIHVYIIYEIVKYIDFLLFYFWAFIHVEIVGGFMIAFTIVFVSVKVYRIG